MSLFADCPLSAYTGAPGTCEWCAAPLVGRARRWCSLTCGSTAWENHAWSNARAAALLRDGGRCVRCGSDGVNHEARGWVNFLEVVCQHPDSKVVAELRFRWREAQAAELAAIGPAPEPAWGAASRAWFGRARAIELAWFGRQYPPHQWWRLFHQMEAAVWRKEGLEVNHIVPILGRHSVNGCHHHLDGLETLCIPDHRSATAAQRAAGAFGPTKKTAYPADIQPALFAEESRG